MKTFRSLKRRKLADPSFKTLYDKECHVCGTTMKIFEVLTEKGISVETLAKELACSTDDIEKLMDAEYCDPLLVQRMCRYLSIVVPDKCPRL